MNQTAAKGFLSSLYDLSFHAFITPKIIQVVYVLALVGVAMGSLAYLGSAFVPVYSFFGPPQEPSFGSILLHIILTPVIFVIGSIVARIYLEFIVAVFRIAENTESLRRES
ncbi:MAG: DUF4282 domain-containing protein [Candidatus Baltobacteraceae bacterium]